MKFYTIFNVTLTNSEGVCRDYIGYLNATITLKSCTKYLMIGNLKIQRKIVKCCNIARNEQMCDGREDSLVL